MRNTYNEEAELVVLCSLIHDNTLINEAIFYGLSPTHFYDRRNGLIFHAIMSLYNENQPFDMVFIIRKLNSVNKLISAGGQEYIISVVQNIPRTKIENYIHILIADSQSRNLITLGGQIVEQVNSGQYPPGEVISNTEQSLLQISKSSADSFSLDISTVLCDVWTDLEENVSGRKTPGIKFGYRELDEIIPIIPRGSYIIIGADSGTGKTTVSLNMAINFAKENIGVGFISMEMPPDSLGKKILSIESEVSFSKLLNPSENLLRETDYYKLSKALGVLTELPIKIDHKSKTTSEIKSSICRMMQEDGRYKIFFVDYIQAVGGKEDRFERIGNLSSMLKDLSKDLGIYIFGLSQFNRSDTGNTSKRPGMGKLKGSTELEHNPDGIILLFRPDRNEDLIKSNPELAGIIEFHVVKNRYGKEAAGADFCAKLIMDGSTGRIYDRMINNNNN